MQAQSRHAKYSLGQVVRHRSRPFRGVIFDVDPEFANTEEWYESIPEDSRPDRDQPFLAVNLAALPEGMVESELFGHEKGAFSGADRRRDGLLRAAGSGTVFLDEIAELPLSAQAKLLRALESHEVQPLGSDASAGFGGLAAKTRRAAGVHHLNLAGQGLPDLSKINDAIRFERRLEA